MDSRMLAAERAGVPPFHVMDLLAASERRARDHGDLLNLLAGQPSSPAPEVVRGEATRLLASTEPLGYTSAVGIEPLRAAIAGHYLDSYGLSVDVDDVIVTTGSSGGFTLAYLAAFDPGDRIAIARPGYPCSRNVAAALGLEVVEIPTGADTRFQPTLEQIVASHAAAPLSGLVLASPANPTGTMVASDDLAAIATWCAEHGVVLLSDEIYHGISYAEGDRAASAWETTRESIVFGSFSKYFSMTGWRIGWMLVPRSLRRAVDVLTGNLTICAPVIAQRACQVAFSPAARTELDGHVVRYARNRDLMLERLTAMGIGPDRVAPADGAFYVYADVGHLTDDSIAFAHRTLDHTGVAVATGLDFDTVDGSRFVRFSFAGATDEIAEALDRLAGYWT